MSPLREVQLQFKALLAWRGVGGAENFESGNGTREGRHFKPVGATSSGR
jgi:hypothetical protein